MKKGAVSAIIGFFIVFAVFMFILPAGGFNTQVIFGMVTPFVFVVIVISIFSSIAKRAENHPSKQQRYYTDKNYQGFDNTVECVSCHEHIDKDFKYCPNCGAVQGDKVTCPYCGTVNDSINSICVNCRRYL